MTELGSTTKMVNFFRITLMSFFIATVYSQKGFEIRLADGPKQSEGRLEIYYKSKWGTVCKDQWNVRDAEVVCRQLGLGPPVQYLINKPLYYAVDGVPIYLGNIQCSGSESRLILCRNAVMEYQYCHNHTQDVALECGSELEEFPVQLAGGIYPNVGRLEVQYQGVWNEICDFEWTYANSQVLCRQLGYARVDDWVVGYKVGSSYPVSYHFKFICDGHESNLKQCSYTESIYNFCFTTAVMLQCTNEEDYYRQGDARLVGHDEKNEGILITYLYGRWGKMCSEYWYSEETDAICRQLGYNYGETESFYKYSVDAVHNIPVHLVQFKCGDHGDLKDCSSDVSYDCLKKSYVAVSCKSESFLRFSGTAIFSIILGSAVGLCLLCACVCCRRKGSQARQCTTVNHIPLDAQVNGADNVQPTVPPFTDLPPSYDCVMKQPVETPPPAYTGYEQPPLDPLIAPRT